MTVLRNVIEETYNHLHQHNLVKSQYQFSKDWLKMSRSYFGYLKSSGAETNADVCMNLWGECRRQKMNWLNAANDNNKSEASKLLFKRLAEKSEKAENIVSEAMKAKYF